MIHISIIFSKTTIVYIIIYCTSSWNNIPFGIKPNLKLIVKMIFEDDSGRLIHVFVRSLWHKINNLYAWFHSSDYHELH